MLSKAEQEEYCLLTFDLEEAETEEVFSHPSWSSIGLHTSLPNDQGVVLLNTRKRSFLPEEFSILLEAY